MSESDFIEIRWTSGGLEEARKICRYLVKERLVACAQIVPWVESIYMWNNQLETTQESKIFLKSQLVNYEQIKKIIIENSQYEIPEITYVLIDGGSQEFLNWVKEASPEYVEGLQKK